jgi:hypothetical protein
MYYIVNDKAADQNFIVRCMGGEELVTFLQGPFKTQEEACDADWDAVPFGDMWLGTKSVEKRTCAHVEVDTYCGAPATKVKGGLYFCDDHIEVGVGLEPA